MSIFKTDIWKTGVLPVPIERVIEAGSIDPFPIYWLPDQKPLCFLADPFGLRHQGDLYVLTEYYDYRTRKGVIKAFKLNMMFQVVQERVVLSEAWHLSYPFLIEADGEIWMLPEAHKSGRLTLYRARQFPWEWEPVPAFSFPWAAIDASPVCINDEWWMFYTPPYPADRRTSTLKIARAPSLFGPWEDISVEPVRTNKGSSRMGGTPVLENGCIILPTQNCERTYGGSLQLMKTSLPLSASPKFDLGANLTAPTRLAPFTDGLHTLSAADNATLIDVKHVLRNSPRRMLVDAIRQMKNYLPR